MELHIVHYKAAYEGDLDAILGSADGLAVTGFMFTIGVRIEHINAHYIRVNYGMITLPLE